MKPIAITLGDPSGIGSEIVLKSLARIPPEIPLWIFGDWNFARQALGGSELPRDLTLTSRTPTQPDALRRFIDIGFSRTESLRFGSIEPMYGQAALDSISAALEAIDSGLCDAMVNAPIHKQSISLAGSPYPGHTELLAAHCGLTNYGKDFAMYFDSPSIKVALASVHISLVDAIRQLTAASIADLARLVDREFSRIYGFQPRIAIAGVNPHAGEGGIFGSEDQFARHAVATASSEGLTISGPHSPDTVFLSASRGRYDVVLAMYHDQGLIPVKILHFESSVNVTMGLPYLRCSVDHGTAFDIAGKGIADAAPMVYAIEWAAKHAERFVR